MSTFEFLHDLPTEPAIGLNKLLGLFYKAMFDHNEKSNDIEDDHWRLWLCQSN
ncbi:hypothetical protein AAULH_12706 [Lactobacillus helveticus MTCC 5463]|nr:hypothetical protein AAULH_12706 [Lactobacillus helveticus MTCC 5463]